MATRPHAVRQLQLRGSLALHELAERIAGTFDPLDLAVSVAIHAKRVSSGPSRWSQPLRALMDAEPERDRLRSDIERLQAAFAGPVAPPGPPVTVDPIVTTGTTTYRLRVSGLDLEPDHHAVVVLVTDTPRAMGTPDDWRERFGMTPREAEVAVALAHGHSNVAIAHLLGVSPHTARHHTERVLTKLGVSRRSQVAARLMP